MNKQKDPAEGVTNHEVGRISKDNDTDIVLVIDDFNGKTGLTVREFVGKATSGFKGFTRSGTKIPESEFQNFKDLVNSISFEDFHAKCKSKKS